jgi:hypothetical protein
MCIGGVLLAAPARADRVYAFNNYPADQDGGTLSGSITVLDSAPDDGVLNIGEVVGWNWTASNDPVSVSAHSAEDGAFFSPGGAGVTITETDILLADQASLQVGVENPGHSAALSYFKNVLSPTIYSAEEDSQFVWITSPAADALGGDPWVIATFVPEPGTVTLLVSALLAISLITACRRSAALR